MKNFLIITNSHKDANLELTHQVVAHIEAKGGKASYCVSNARRKDAQDRESVVVPKETECILVLGGDGTLIRAATEVSCFKLPVIGVNIGNLGYLCELTRDTVFEGIDRLMNQDYMLEERMMLTGYKGNLSERKFALNDVVIHREGLTSIVSLQVYVNGKLLNTYHGDGIIVATPTGSTGYNMSAGGPIVDPTTDVILLTPISAHNLNAKSIVLGAGEEIEIEIGARRAEKDERVSVSFDGDVVAELAVGQRFHIAKADNKTKICKLNDKSFLELLSKKMQTYN